MLRQAQELQQALLASLVPVDEADQRSAVLEVRAGTGGEEASLFAGDLLRMYEAHCRAQGWRFEVGSRRCAAARRRLPPPPPLLPARLPGSTQRSRSVSAVCPETPVHNRPRVTATDPRRRNRQQGLTRVLNSVGCCRSLSWRRGSWGE